MQRDMIDYNLYPNFTAAEFRCRETGEDGVREELVAKMQQIRNMMRMPLIISSGYRSLEHSLERDKKFIGEHAYGLACDVSIYGVNAMRLVRSALMCGVTRVGVKQNGDISSRYIHVGIGDKLMATRFLPTIWSY